MTGTSSSASPNSRCTAPASKPIIGVEHDGAKVEVKTHGRGILVLEHAEATGVEFGTGFPSKPHRCGDHARSEFE